MNFIDIMDFIQALPQTKQEWAQAAVDTAGIAVTTLWLTGAHQLTNGLLQTGLAAVTFLSVSYSFYIKIKDRNKTKKP